MTRWQDWLAWAKRHATFANLRHLLAIAGVLIVLAVGVLATWTMTRTPGEIIVSSPQVYTRERLVNDRYDEAHWLQKQLKLLDSTADLTTGTITKSIERSVHGGVTIGQDSTGPSSAETRGNSAGAVAKEASLPFDLQFVIRASIRDTIRELALENSLDDRHDLRGNSIYGLKFDTTVIPGSERDSALIDVSVDLEDLGTVKAYTEKQDPDMNGLPQYISDYYRNASGQNASSKRTLVYRLNQIYLSWVSDVERRLNQYSEKLSSRESCPCPLGSNCPSAKKIAEQALAGVLGEKIALPASTFTAEQYYISSWPVPLGYPLNSVLHINVSAPAEASAECSAVVKFSVSPVLDQVYHVDLSNHIPASYFNGNNLFEIGTNGSGVYLQILDVQLTSFLSFDGDRILKIHQYLQQKNLLSPTQLPPLDKTSRSPVQAKYFLMPTGLFNFIERAAKEDQFAYALLPRSELAGYLVDNLSSTAASVEAAGATGQVGGGVKVVNALREARASPRTVGFVEAKGGKIEFGWFVDSNQLDRPTQKSHLALVSIPAWISEIKLCIRTSWKSSGLKAAFKRFHTAADVSKDCDQELNVPVPEDMEALDSIIISSIERPPPRIFSQLMDNSTLTACSPASILVPGEHLWRNTVVTLGGQRASRIIVLPDMRGIVAEFDSLLPTGAPDTAAAPDDRLVRVWTTEGSDTASKAIRVMQATNPTHCKGITFGNQSD